MKTCTKCREVKSLDAFGKHAQTKDGLYPSCRACQRAQAAAYLAANLNQERARKAAYRAANPEKDRESSAVHLADNRETIRARSLAWHHAHPEKQRAQRAAHPDRQSAYAGRHRARRHNAPGDGVTATQWEQVIRDSLGVCAYCNERKPLTMDHVVPLSRGGEHDVTNVVAACYSCNASKRNKSLVVWLALRAA